MTSPPAILETLWAASLNTAPSTPQLILDAFTNYQSGDSPESLQQLLRLLRRVKVSALISSCPNMHDTIVPVISENNIGFPFFIAEGQAQALTGQLAFTTTEADMLREANPDANVIMATNDGGCATIAGLIGQQGFIFVGGEDGESATHLEIIVRALGIPALLTYFDHATQHGIAIGQDNDGWYLQLGQQRLRTGAMVTLDPYERRIFAGQLPLRNVPPDPHWQAFHRWITGCFDKLQHQDAPSFTIPVAVFPQIDQPQSATPTGHIGLIRLENAFLDTAGQNILSQAILAPTAERLLLVQERASHHINAIANATQCKHADIRLLDFKPDQCCTPQEAAAIQNKLQLNDLRGFALAHVLPELYQAQMRGVCDALSTLQQKVEVTFCIPRTEHPEDVALARQLLDTVHCDHQNPYRLAIMLESQVGLDASHKIIVETYNNVGADNVVLLLGSGDRVQEATGLRRNAYHAIAKWMRENRSTSNPFTGGSNILWSMLEQVQDSIESARRELATHGQTLGQVDVRLCGPQAGNIDVLRLGAALGLTSVAVSPTLVPSLIHEIQLTAVMAYIKALNMNNHTKILPRPDSGAARPHIYASPSHC